MTKDEAQSACGGQMDFLQSRQSWEGEFCFN
jgi:hypothetical protein